MLTLSNFRGLVQSFGVFQAYYKLQLLLTYSTSAISWVSSTQSFLLVFIGMLAGSLFDRGYLRSLNGTGNVLIVLGLMTTSAATKYYQVFLCFRLGCGCMFIFDGGLPMYFSTKRSIAIGLASLGSGLGEYINLDRLRLSPQ